MLCGELQPIGADMPILIRCAQAPSAKGLLNLGNDTLHDVVHRVAGERHGLDGPWRLLVFLVDEVDGRGDGLVVRMLGKGCATGCACRLCASGAAYAQYRWEAGNR